IPSNVVHYAYTSLRKDGHVHRTQIGIFARTITDSLATALNLDPDKGILVEDLVEDGPAENADIHVGDVVLSMDGTPLHNVREFGLQLYQYAIGDTAKLEVMRGSEKLNVDVAVTESPDDPERFAEMVNPEENLIPQLAILGV